VLLYAGTGVLAGFLAGLFGVGGGLIIVPALAYCFYLQGIDSVISMHLAIGTSLATIILTSLSSMKAHHAHAAVQWLVVKRMSVGILLGGIIGALIADALKSEVLKSIFAIFEILVAIKLLTRAQVKSIKRNLPGLAGSTIAGVSISAVSAVVGIGGGTLSVPFLRWAGLSIQQAIATSAALGLPIAISGSLAFMWTGANRVNLPEYSIGFVYLPAFSGVGLLSVWLAPLGARCAHRLPANVLQNIFALGLLIVAILLLIS